MSGGIEVGVCDMCGGTFPLNRKYYRYPVVCDCCNGKQDNHFEIVRYCDNCKPSPPHRISAVVKCIINKKL